MSLGLENELKTMIVSELKIEDVTPAQIEDSAPLFGEGLGLDSLDAVELVVSLQKYYDIEIKNIEEARDAFASIKSLADYVRLHRDGEVVK